MNHPSFLNRLLVVCLMVLVVLSGLTFQHREDADAMAMIPISLKTASPSDPATETRHLSIPHLIHPCYIPLVLNCPPPSHPLENGDFELGERGWFFYPPSGIVTGDDVISPHGGNLMASIINYGIAFLYPGYMEQSFSVPYCFPYLRFWWASNIGCGAASRDRCGGELSISVNGMPFTSWHVSGGGLKDWEKVVVDLSVYTGSTIVLRFAPRYSARDSMNNYIDDITFQSHP